MKNLKNLNLQDYDRMAISSDSPVVGLTKTLEAYEVIPGSLISSIFKEQIDGTYGFVISKYNKTLNKYEAIQLDAECKTKSEAEYKLLEALKNCA